MIYRFNCFELDADREILTGPDGQIALRGHALLVLKLLIERAPGVVTRDEILEQVWGHQALSESSIAQVVREIRTALDDSKRSPMHVATRYGRGYQFVADVEVVDEPRQAPAPVRRVGSIAATLVLVVAVVFALLQWIGRPLAQGSDQDRIVLRALQAGSGESLSEPFVDYLAFVLGQTLGVDRVSIASEDDPGDPAIGIGLNALSEGKGGMLELLLENVGAEDDSPTRERFEEAGKLMQASLDRILESIEFDGEVAIEAGLISKSSYAIETLLRGMAAQFAGELDRAVALFDAALAEDPDFDFARYELAIALRRTGEYGRAGAMLEAMATRLDRDFWVVRIHNALGILYWRQDEHEKALAAYRRAEEVATSPALRGAVLTNIGLLERTLGDLEQAESTLREAIAESERGESPRLVASARNSLASVLMRTGRQDEALAELAIARELFYEIGNRSAYAGTLSRTARLQEHLGNNQEARSLLALVANVREQLGDELGVAATRIRQSRLERLAGDFDTARPLAVQGLELARSGSDDRLVLDGYSALAALALADRRIDDARSYGREAENIARRLGRDDRVLEALLGLVEVDLVAGTTTEGLSDRIESLITRVEAREDAPRIIHARMLRARLDQRAGRIEDARRDLEFALELALTRDDRLFLRVEFALVELDLEQDRTGPALARLGELERIDPPAHPFLMLKARALAAAGRYREAVEAGLEARSVTGDWWRPEDQARLDRWKAAQAGQA